MNLIAYAVPFFFVLIFIELAYGRVTGTNYYRLNDALTSLATGLVSRLVTISKALLPFTIYIMVYQSFSIFTLGDSAVVWFIAFIAYDFCYYWRHRFGHEMNILWAGHVVHHSSEEYNLTTALRQSSSGFLSFIFYLPLAILGFEPLMIITVGALNLIYQFWVHTRHIGKLGWYELVFVTPSNHRGHHAQNTIYIDKNYGGVFILWDRLFATYQEELDDDKLVFGIRGAVQSWNPIWVNLQVYKQLLQDAIHTKHWWYKLSLWFRRTGWRPPDIVEAYPLAKNDDLNVFQKYDTHVPTLLKVHCVIQYIATTAIGFGFISSYTSLVLSEHMLVVSFIFLSTFSIGALMENQSYSGVLEWLRLSVLLIIVAISPINQPLSAFLIVSAVVCLPLLWFGRRESLCVTA